MNRRFVFFPLCAAIAGTLGSSASTRAAQDAITARPVAFTTDEGTWISLDVSPDGRTIAFELLGDIYGMPAAGGQARPLLSGPAFQAQPRFSPDGRRIAYISDETGSDNVWIANVDGTGARALTSLPRVIMTSPAWAPDGSSIYVTVIDNRVAALWRVDIASGKAESLVPNGSGAPSLLVSAPAPGPYGAHVSPDGRWLYYAAVTPRAHGVRQGAASRIVRRNLATGRDEPVTLDMPVGMRPVLSPDGRLLAYGAQTQGRTGLRIRDLASETERWLRIPLDRNQLEARASRDTLPGYAFTPDGAAIVVTYGGRIHRIDVATAKATEVPFSADVSLAITPAPSMPHRIDQGPVRARLVHQPALATDGRTVFSALGRLFVAEAAGAPRRLTTSATPREFMPAWSRDGQSIAFVTWSSEGGHLWKVSSRGGTPTRLTDAAGFWADPVWTPDGRSVIALRAPVMSGRTSPFPVPGDAQIVSVPASGGAPKTIAPAGGGRHPHFAPDATRVYVSGPEGLVSYALADGGRTVHATFPKRMGPFGPQPMEVRLSPDGTRAALAVGDSLYRLALPPLATPPQVLDPDAAGAVEVTRRAPLGFAFAPDGSLAWVTGRTLNTLGASEAPAAARRLALDAQVARSTPAGSVVLRGARVITMRGSEVIENADVVVTGNRIAAVGARGTVATPSGARVVDIAGRTLMPGLIDIHAHWNVRREVLEPDGTNAYANLAYGTTTVRDPQSAPDIFTYADMADAGDFPSPRIFSTGPGVFSVTDFQSLEETRAFLARYAEDYGTRYLKSYLAGSRRQRRWIADASRDMGLLATTEGGADDKQDLTHAMDGYSGIEHALPATPIYRDVVELLARTGITYTPTLLVSFGGALPVYREHLQERPIDDARLRRFSPPDTLFDRTQTRLLAFPDEDYNYRDAGAGAAAVLRAGGHVALGGHGEIQGLQNHWEMRLLAQSGMPLHDVLRVATLEGARALGLEQDLGSIEPGKLADLIVLERSPLQDIRATTSIRRVMKNGVLYDSDTLATVYPTETAPPPRWWATSGNSAPEAQAADVSSVDSIVRAEMDGQRIPGLAVAILRGDRVLLSKGYGFANLEHGVPVTAQTMFQSGSVGKMFTSAAVMSLVERGILDLEAPVRTYLPEAPASWDAIRLKHLLTHTAGVPDYTGEAFDYRKDYTEAELARLAFEMPLEFTPGLRWNYSNTGYAVLGVLLSRVTGKPYWEYLRERLFTPAGMPTARVISEADVVPRRAAGYLVDSKGEYRNQDWVAPLTNTTADGSLLLSLEDMIAWARASRERRVIAESSWARVQSPVVLNSGKPYPYGMGWSVEEWNGKPYLQHGGSWQGFRTQFSYFAGSDLTVIVMGNSRTTDPLGIANRLAAAVDPSLTPPAPPAAPLAGVDPAISSYVKQILEKTQRGELTMADFEFMRQSLVPRLSAAYAAMLKPLGAIQIVEPQSRSFEGDDIVYTYRARFAQGVARVQVKLGPGGRLTGLFIRRAE